VFLTAAANSAALAKDMRPIHEKPLGFYSYGTVVGGALYPQSTNWGVRRAATYSDPPVSSCPILEGYPDCHPQ
jgi:hypothetical protein